MDEKIDYKGYTIEINFDEDPEDPREWDNLGTIITRKFWNESDISAYDRDAVLEHIAKVEKDGGIVLPIYVYSHGVDRFRTRDFYDAGLPEGHARFDSGLAGFIYVELEKIRKEYGVKRVTKAIRERAAQVLQGEIETVDAYSCGAVYGYETKDAHGNFVDSCWGFYDEKDMIESYAKPSIDFDLQKASTHEPLMILLD